MKDINTWLLYTTLHRDKFCAYLVFTPFSETRSVNQQIRETFAVLPSELQALPPLEGYLLIADGTKPAKVKVTPTDYPPKASRFVDAAI